MYYDLSSCGSFETSERFYANIARLTLVCWLQLGLCNPTRQQLFSAVSKSNTFATERCCMDCTHAVCATRFSSPVPGLLILFLAFGRITAKQNRVVALKLVYFTVLMVTLPVGTFFLFHDFLLTGELRVFFNARRLMNYRHVKVRS